MARTRLPYRVKQPDAGTGVILDKVLPFNATLLQYSARVQGAVVASFSCVVTKVSVIETAYDVVIFSWDPTLLDSDDIICNDHWEYLKGDHVTITSANPDGLIIGHELIFKEAE